MSEFSRQELQQALQCVTASRAFARSKQLRRLLSYLVAAVVHGRQDMLKESVIAVELFRFPADFDPKRDPVVRMAMRRLRQRLEQYYLGDGSADRIVISLKPGSYVPQFLPKTSNTQHRARIAVLPAEDREEGIDRLLILGRHCLTQNNRESIKKSEEYFRAALVKQPASARAWANLSAVQSCMGLYFLKEASEARRDAKLYADRAIALDPHLADGYAAAGMQEVMASFEPITALPHFRKAVQLNPHDPSPRIMLALTCLAPVGRLREAEQELTTIVTNDPVNAKGLQALSVVLYFQRRYRQASEMARAALDILPRSAVAAFTLANCYDQMGCESEALMQCRKCEELMPYLRILRWPAVLGAIYKGRGKWVRPGLLAAAKLLEASPRAPSAMIADLFLKLGEHQRGIQWMQRAFRERGLRALYLKVDPAFESIRSSPECAEMLRHLESRNGELSQTVVA